MENKIWLRFIPIEINVDVFVGVFKRHLHVYRKGISKFKQKKKKSISNYWLQKNIEKSNTYIGRDPCLTPDHWSGVSWLRKLMYIDYWLNLKNPRWNRKTHWNVTRKRICSSHICVCIYIYVCVSVCKLIKTSMMIYRKTGLNASTTTSTTALQCPKSWGRLNKCI